MTHTIPEHRRIAHGRTFSTAWDPVKYASSLTVYQRPIPGAVVAKAVIAGALIGFVLVTVAVRFAR